MMPPASKPFYAAISLMILLPLLVVLANGICMLLYDVRTLQMQKVDNIFHILGGFSVCLTSAGFLWHLVHRKTIVLQDKKVFYALVFGFLCFTIIGWEIFEYLVLHPYEFLTYDDTISDMVCGIVGGAVAIFFLQQPTFEQNAM